MTAILIGNDVCVRICEKINKPCDIIKPDQPLAMRREGEEMIGEGGLGGKIKEVCK